MTLYIYIYIVYVLCICICICICMYVCMYVCMYIYIYIYIHNIHTLDLTTTFRLPTSIGRWDSQDQDGRTSLAQACWGSRSREDIDCGTEPNRCRGFSNLAIGMCACNIMYNNNDNNSGTNALSTCPRVDADQAEGIESMRIPNVQDQAVPCHLSQSTANFQTKNL